MEARHNHLHQFLGCANPAQFMQQLTGSSSCDALLVVCNGQSRAVPVDQGASSAGALPGACWLCEGAPQAGGLIPLAAAQVQQELEDCRCRACKLWRLGDVSDWPVEAQLRSQSLFCDESSDRQHTILGGIVEADAADVFMCCTADLQQVAELLM